MKSRGRVPGPIRVLHLRDSPWVDGPARTILETAAHIDPRRIEYHIGAFVSDAGRPHPFVERAKARGNNVHCLNDHGGLDRALISGIVDLIDKLGIDILHSSEFRSSFFSYVAGRRRRVRLVRTVHGWIANDARGRIFSLLDRMLLRGFDRIVLVARAVRRRLPSWWVADRKVRVLQNALAESGLLRDCDLPSRRVPGPCSEVRLLNVGRLSPEKGQLLLLEAMAALCREHAGLKLAFAGKGPLLEALAARAKELGIEDKVQFLGYVNDMVRLYLDADLVVQSSLSEGLPNVVLESASLGVPIVATDVGGTSEVLDPGQSGMLVRSGSSQEIERGVRAYLADPGKFVKLARSGVAAVRARFSMVARTEGQMQLYEELMVESQ